MLSPKQNDPLALTREDKAKLSAYLNGASFSIDRSGREKFIPRIETVEDDLKVIYIAERSGVGQVTLSFSVGLRSRPELYDLSDFGLDLVDYANDQRVTGELQPRRTIRSFPGLIPDRNYKVFPHGDEGGSEVLDPVRRPPPSLREAELPARSLPGLDVRAGSGELAGRRN